MDIDPRRCTRKKTPKQTSLREICSLNRQTGRSSCLRTRQNSRQTKISQPSGLNPYRVEKFEKAIRTALQAASSPSINALNQKTPKHSGPHQLRTPPPTDHIRTASSCATASCFVTSPTYVSWSCLALPQRRSSAVSTTAYNISVNVLVTIPHSVY